MFIERKELAMTHYVIYEGHVAVSVAAMQESYINELMPIANDPEVTRGLNMKPPITLEDELEWYRGLSKNKANKILAVLKHSDGDGLRYIGHMGIHNIKPQDGTGTTGSILGPSSELKKGYGTEAKLLLMRYAFEVLGLRKLNSSVKGFNARSLGHLLKCGYEVIGVRKEQIAYHGRYVDEILLDATYARWEPIWSNYHTTGTLPSLSKKQRMLIKRLTCAE